MSCPNASAVGQRRVLTSRRRPPRARQRPGREKSRRAVRNELRGADDEAGSALAPNQQGVSTHPVLAPGKEQTTTVFWCLRRVRSSLRKRRATRGTPCRGGTPAPRSRHPPPHGAAGPGITDLPRACPQKNPPDPRHWLVYQATLRCESLAYRHRIIDLPAISSRRRGRLGDGRRYDDPGMPGDPTATHFGHTDGRPRERLGSVAGSVNRVRIAKTYCHRYE